MSVNYLDVLLLGLLGYFMYTGFQNGLFKEFVAISALIIACVFAAESLAVVVPVVAGASLLSPSASVIVVFLLLFFGVLFLLKYLQDWIHQRAKLQFGDKPDKFVAAFIGICKGILIGGLFSIFLSLMPISGSIANQVSQSGLHPRMIRGAQTIYNAATLLIPGSLSLEGNLEQTADQVGTDRFSSNFHSLLRDLGSNKASTWQRKAKK